MAARRPVPRVRTQPLMGACVESFLLALEAGNYSRHTVNNYAISVRQCADAIGNPELRTVTAEAVQRYLAELAARGLKPATRATRYRALVTFFNWCVRGGLLSTSPMAGVLPVKEPETEPVGYSDDELRRLVAACDASTLWGARDRAIVLVLYATALRVGELVQLRRADLEGGTAPLLRVLGKGRRERAVSLGRMAREAVALYLLRRGEDDEPALWVGKRGPLGERGVQDLVNKLGSRAGVHAHPHKFRNASLAAMLARGMDPASVQRISGHRSLAMLQRYVGYDESRRANTRLLEVGHVEHLLGSPPRKRASRPAGKQ